MAMAQKRSRREYEADLRKQEAPFVLYGTPLPLLDDHARDDGSYVPIWKQEVTDDRGRKRLHGAFTGGYSAGYFNTVGSKEGWAPSTFVSSRSNRAKDTKTAKQQTVEDFMDEEDVREREELREVSTADAFAGFGTSDDAGVQHAMDDIFPSNEDTMGEKLLIRMGWKKGHGIGPRVLRSINPDDPNSEAREFPPDDSPMLSFPQKQDTKGLGFNSTDAALPQSVIKPSSKTQDLSQDDNGRPGLSFMHRPNAKAEKPVRTGGIGVGTLNDTGSDDEDAYDMGPKMSYNRVIGGNDKKGKKLRPLNGTSSNANPLLKTKPVFISRSKLPSALNSLRKCHDGKLPLTGFVLADELDSFSSMSLSDEKYKPPEVPEDWQPAALKHSTSDQALPSSSTTTTQSQTQTAESRRRALALPSLPAKSVFDFLSPAARDRLATATGNQNLPPALNEAPPTSSLPPADADPSTSSTTSMYPPLDPPTATTALQRLRLDPRASRPYATDIQKQTRYKDFLRYSADSQPAHLRVPPLRDPSHKEGQEGDAAHIAELNEFVATAQLFKPVSGFFASRFTSAASTSKEGAEAGAGDGQGIAGTEDGDGLVRRPAAKPSDPAEEAARMGMFGAATRTSKSWMPTKLVCKRFAVEMPVGIE